MDIDVASAIAEILDRRKTVSIAGLGSLIIENYSAKISDDQQQISPPSATLNFYKTQTSNKPLRKYLMHKYDISKEQAQKVIKKFNESAVNALSNYGEVNIAGVGSIRRQTGEILVDANEAFINKYYRGLPLIDVNADLMHQANTEGQAATDKDISAQAAQKAQKQLPSDSPAQKLAQPESPSLEMSSLDKTPAKLKVASDSNKIAPPSPKLDSVKESVKISPTLPHNSAAGAKTIKTPQEQQQQFQVPSAKNPETVPPKTSDKGTVGAKEGVHVNDLFLQNMSESPRTTPNTGTVDSKTISSSYIKPVDKVIPPSELPKFSPEVPTPMPFEEKDNSGRFPLYALLAMLLCFLAWKGCGYLKGTKANTQAAIVQKAEDTAAKADGALAKVDGTVAKVDGTVENTVDDISNKSISTDANAANSKDDDTKFDRSAVGGVNEQCIIITGVYAQDKNIDRMANRLERAGLSVYFEDYGSYTRVGFQFDCEGVNYAEYITNIRETIHPKAWYLEPQLHIAY